MNEINVRRAEFADVDRVTEIQAVATRAVFAQILGEDSPALDLINPRDLRGTWRSTLPAVNAWLATREDPDGGAASPTNLVDCGMAVILPRDTQTGLASRDVGELVVEVLPGPEALDVLDALIKTAVQTATDLELQGLGVWVMAGDELHTRALTQRGFAPEGLTQLLENPDGATLRAHLWALELSPTSVTQPQTCE